MKTKKIIALLLCLMMLTSLLAGCGVSEKDQIVGVWKGDLELTEALNQVLAEDEEMGQYLRLERFTLSATLTFSDDDTYTLTMDRTSMNDAIADMLVQLEGGLLAYFEDMLAQEALGMNVEEFLEALGIDIGDLLAESFTEEMVTEMLSAFEQEGNFKVSGGKLYLSQGLDYAVDEAVYETYSIDDDQLTITAGSDDGDTDIMELVYPMVFTKV